MVSFILLSMVGPALVDCADSGGPAANNQDAINDLRMLCGKKFQYRHSGKVPEVIEVRTPVAISSLTNDMESVNRLRRDYGLQKDDGYTNRKERQRPCNLVEVGQDAALHIPSRFSLSRVGIDGAVRKPLRSVKICKFADDADS
jgi:hypothetical protein